MTDPFTFSYDDIARVIAMLVDDAVHHYEVFNVALWNLEQDFPDFDWRTAILSRTKSLIYD